jgi:hypothetical protein
LTDAGGLQRRQAAVLQSGVKPPQSKLTKRRQTAALQKYLPYKIYQFPTVSVLQVL